MTTLKIMVKPNSLKNEIISMDGDRYKIAIKEAPDKGKANKELVKFLHKITKKKVTIVSGLKSREKIVELE